LHDRKASRLLALKNFPGVGADQTVNIPFHRFRS
jgi:hypothetical protein